MSRLIRNLLPFILLGAIAVAQNTPAPVQAVDAIGITISDMDRSIAFYADVLAFKKISDMEVTGDAYEDLGGGFAVRRRVVRMQLGGEFIELTQYVVPTGRPLPVDSRSNDRWFQHIAIITSNMDHAYAWLRKHHVQHASPAPQRLPDWNKNAGGIEAFYFKDPDGHPLEVLQFPDGKGDAKWHRSSSELFLGIDHTAIVVGDTATSLRFYRGLLGFHIAGKSENYGIEQERLNNVSGAHLRITSLRATAGPGIELLQYLSPCDGRAYPQDEHANDIVHWQTQLRTSAAEHVAAILRSSHVQFVSAGVVTIAKQSAKAFLVRDPDGHAIEMVQK
jgi:catechol 2,3-dioxygenase-like lactoylglutathione lyase family enzyme